MFKKVIFSVFFCFIVLVNICSEDIYLYAKESGKVYRTERDVIGTLKKGERYRLFTPNHLTWFKSKMRLRIEFNSMEGWVDPALLFNENSDSFNDEILNNNNERVYGWMQSYYLDVVRSGKRDKLYEFEPYWRDDYWGHGGTKEWWDYDFGSISFKFNNVMINAGSRLTLYVSNIEQISKTDYRIKVKILNSFISSYKFDFTPVKNKEYFTMIIKQDGDYMTIYLENESQKFAELVKGNKTIVDALHKTVKNEKVDLSKVEWPLREAEKKNIKEVVKESLENKIVTSTIPKMAIFSGPGLKNKRIMVIESGTPLYFIEYGKEETLGNMNGRWVKVKTERGEIGWCFDYYLKVVSEIKDTTINNSKKNYYTPTVDNLRFRATPTLDGPFIRQLKAGEKLELIEQGKTETIGDAKGTWVKVKTAQGEVGWCFDAYLKELK